MDGIRGVLMREKISIAIDGPSGAGKSTLAQMIAERFGLLYIDTGAIYRAVGLFAMRKGILSEDEAGVVSLLPAMKLELSHDDTGVQRIFVNGEDVSEEIRLPEVSIYASRVSAIPDVRAFLLEMQRKFAEQYDVIMDGRDIGTVVLPDAELKIFLTASSEERARRRYQEFCAKGVKTTYEDVLRDIIRRDKNDSGRAVSPLAPAEDSIVVNTTGNSLADSCDQLAGLVKERIFHGTSL